MWSRASRNCPEVLILGVFLDDLVENVAGVTNSLRTSAHWSVTVSWMANGVTEVPKTIEEFTSLTSRPTIPKFDALNRLLDVHDTSLYDAVLLIDDDISLEEGWLDRFLEIQFQHDFALAQPARCAGSFIDHPFTQQLLGIDARETRFVEIGPVVSVTRAAYDLVFPLDTSWPMGWGLDYVWPLSMKDAGLRMGIVDGAPVRHDMRKPQTRYDDTLSREDMERKSELIRLLPKEEAQVIVSSRALRFPDSDSAQLGRVAKISVVIATRNRSEYLSRAMAALAVQTIPRDEFEVIIVDDGSTDDTELTALTASDSLSMIYLRQASSGLASARNYGLCAASGEVVLFLDDDDIASPTLLEAHVLAHEKFDGITTAVLGYTGLGGSARQSALMRHIVGRGSQLFSYSSLDPHARLDYMHFWGGRSSVKRLLLLETGVFDQRFTFGAEDIELGYRLSVHGFEVVYVPEAVSWMQRTLSWQEFLQRTSQQGRAYAQLEAIHPDSDLLDRLGIPSALDHYPELHIGLDQTRERVSELLELANRWRELGIPLTELFTTRLGSLIDAAYWGTLLKAYLGTRGPA